MAIRTIITSGNWSDPATWDEGEVPTVDDDVVWQEGDVFVDTSDATCNSLNLSEFNGMLSFGNGTVLTIVESIYLSHEGGLTLANPVDKFNCLSSFISIWYDGERSVAVFDNGSDIYFIPYV